METAASGAGTREGTVDRVLGRLLATLLVEVSTAAIGPANVTGPARGEGAANGKGAANGDGPVTGAGGSRLCAMIPVGSVAFAEVLDGRAPGLDLVDVLEGLDPGELHDATLIEAIAGWERVTSWAAARQAGLVAELAHRREVAGLGDFVGDEVASRLVCTRSVAERKVDLAVGLERLPGAGDALAAGGLDVRKATALVEGVAHLSDEVAAAVTSQVLPAAPAMTAAQLAARIRKVELAIDAGAAVKRQERARAQRHVSVTPTVEGMAWLSALLPADEAMAAFAAIDALAAAAVPGDDRPIDARRADAFADVFRRILDTGVGVDGADLPVRHGRRPHLQVTAAATTLLGLDEVPGELAGYGPIPAWMVRAIAADATWRRIFTDPATGEFTGIGPAAYRPGADLTGFVLARDVTCTFPGCRVNAWRCQLDHRVPFDHDLPGHDQTTCANVHTLCQHHHLLKTFAGWHVTKHASTGATEWTAPTGHVYERPATALQEPTPAGSSGSAGVSGSTGASGSAGVSGSAGSPGSAGVSGSAGLSGSDPPNPLDGPLGHEQSSDEPPF